ncbi:hypothetical protein BH20VER3_BH20VER3_09360 [soil metagenome]
MFAGNPAGVWLLEEWLPNEQLPAIRGAERLFCEDRGERVGIGGEAVAYVEGRIHLPA